MDKCDVAGGLLGAGINELAEQLGLAPMPLGGGPAVELEPGYLVKRELSLLCKKGKDKQPSLLKLDLEGLTSFTQGYLVSRLGDLASQQQDAKLGIPGKRFETPSFGLGFIHLPGEGSVVVWRDPSKQGIAQVNAVLLKWSFKF
jgi:hypothetical protein